MSNLIYGIWAQESMLYKMLLQVYTIPMLLQSGSHKMLQFDLHLYFRTLFLRFFGPTSLLVLCFGLKFCTGPLGL